MIPIIGICGGAGEGKGTTASVLVEDHGFHEIALADPLKENLCKWLCEDLGIQEFSMEAQSTHPRNHLVRAVQQVYGTQIERAKDPEVWVKILAVRILEAQGKGAPGVVVPDVRFPDDEATAIKGWGGLLFFTERPGHEEEGINAAHASESHLPRLREMSDHILVNDTPTADEFRGRVRHRVAAILSSSEG